MDRKEKGSGGAICIEMRETEEKEECIRRMEDMGGRMEEMGRKKEEMGKKKGRDKGEGERRDE